MIADPHPIDVQVGQAVRRERRAAGWTQERLAAAIGVSFQQLQKYERGTNRIGATRLHDICKALGVRVAVMYGESDAQPPPHAPELMRQIQDLSPRGRQAIRAVVGALSDVPG